MLRTAYVIGVGAGLTLLIGGVYGMTSLYTMSWGVPTFIVGLFVTIISSIVLITRLVNGQGPATGVLGQMKSFLGTGNKDLIGTGVPAQALVTSMRDTGTMVNDQLVVAFDLQVQPADGAPYVVSHRQILPRLLMGAVLPGRLVRIWSDPANPQRLAIDWSALPTQA
ncbi:hypothetical protein N5079_33590 [Planotetraspora sp. A-T 1434]|uniref:hypothetical protein n=1 Tax=Planotetraspora sp. A-T 1434 TaxID=2979219 RepID=UPI0021C0B746|nr:hypothetical protein [Planotetraspora sp. A-T 1434]MCT9935147.1 hypothetical protein [Planotetraspora sp. A-T 1434]